MSTFTGKVLGTRCKVMRSFLGRTTFELKEMSMLSFQNAVCGFLGHAACVYMYADVCTFSEIERAKEGGRRRLYKSVWVV